VVNVNNPEQILLPGMTAYVNIAVAERKDVLLVPNAALRFKPANIEIQKPPANQNPVTNQKPDAQKSGGRPGDTQGGAKPKRDAFSGKVYVLEQGEIKPVSVTLGITDNRNTEIVSGELKVGDQIIVGDAQASDQSKSSSSSRPPMRMF
jgi:HlyD family secretion protein